MSTEKPAAPVRLVALTPELWRRVERTAADTGKSHEAVVSEAIAILWVRHAGNKGIKPVDW